jgi:hypothetical protein
VSNSPKQFLRKKKVAERYQCDPVTVMRMSRDGRIPKPIYKGRWPIWDADELDAHDRATVRATKGRPVSTHVEA